jgi:Mg2+-importing ATPase
MQPSANACPREHRHSRDAAAVYRKGRREAKILTAVLPKRLLASGQYKPPTIRVAPIVAESAAMDAAHVYARLGTRPQGLTVLEAQERLEQYGPNVLARDRRAGFGKLLWRAVLNPLVMLLAALASISFATGDLRAGFMMLSMIVLSVGLKLVHETRAGSAAAKLKAMISVTASVSRGGAAHEIPVAQLVPGDVVQLTAGDMVPGDVRIVQAKDLFVSQGALTGESFPVEKSEIETSAAEAATASVALRSIAFLGTSVESGSASAVVVATGKST